MQKDSIARWGSLIAIVIALATAATFFFSQPAAPTAGGITTGTAFPHGISVGLAAIAPTNVKDIHIGRCSLIAANYVSLSATTTLTADCAVTGVVAGDIVEAQFATSTGQVYGGWIVTGASASTTSGFISISYHNGTGAAATIPAAIASTTQYEIFATQ